MPRTGKGWKEAGLDTSPVRPEPTDPRVLAEMAYGARAGRANAWVAEGKVIHDETRSAYIAKGTGYIIGAANLMDDVEFARFALSVKAGG